MEEQVFFTASGCHPRHKKIATIISRKFVTDGLCEDDLFQEAMLALLKASQTFKPTDGRATFETYASRCIHNRLIDVIRKHQSDVVVVELDDYNATTPDLESQIDKYQRRQEIKAVLDSLQPIERAIFNAYANGYCYSDIGKIFDLPKKKIDNTIQKIKKGIRS